MLPIFLGKMIEATTVVATRKLRNAVQVLNFGHGVPLVHHRINPLGKEKIFFYVKCTFKGVLIPHTGAVIKMLCSIHIHGLKVNGTKFNEMLEPKMQRFGVQFNITLTSSRHGYTSIRMSRATRIDIGRVNSRNLHSHCVILVQVHSFG